MLHRHGCLESNSSTDSLFITPTPRKKINKKNKKSAAHDPWVVCSPSSSGPLPEAWTGPALSWDLQGPLLPQIPGGPITTGSPVFFSPHILSSSSFRPWDLPGSCLPSSWCCCHWPNQPSCPLSAPSYFSPHGSISLFSNYYHLISFVFSFLGFSFFLFLSTAWLRFNQFVSCWLPPRCRAS